MKEKRSYILPFLFFFVFIRVGFLYGQGPAYFTIGADELENVEVYSIVSDDNEGLYASTNQGVYSYVHGQFVKLKGSVHETNMSLFGLIKDGNGDLFCYNLSGQIFKIVGEKVELYCQIPVNLITNKIKLFCDEEGQLHLFSKGFCCSVKKNQYSILESFAKKNKYIGVELSVLNNGRVLISYGKEDQHGEIRNGAMHEFKNTGKDQDYESTYFRTLFELDSKLIIAEKGGVFRDSANTFKLQAGYDYKNRLFSISGKEVWGLRNTTGLNSFRLTDNRLEISDVYFEDIFISTCWVAEDKTIFLGTFGQGVLVIPNRNMRLEYEKKGNGKIRDFVVTDEGHVYLSEMGVGIMEVNYRDTKVIEPERGEFFSRIFWSEGTNFNLSKRVQGLFFDNYLMNSSEVIIPTARDIVEIDETQFLVATSKGVYLKGDKNFINPSLWEATEQTNLFKIKGRGKRCLAIASDDTREQLFVADRSATYYYTSAGEKRFLKFEGSDFVSEDLFFSNGMIWCATLSHGILVFKSEVLEKQFSLALKEDERVRQIYVNDQRIFALIDSYVVSKNLANGKVSYLGCAEGVRLNVNKFIIVKERIWLLLQNSKIQSAPLSVFERKERPISIFLRSLRVEGVEIKSKSEDIFPYNNNEFVFELAGLNPVFGVDAEIYYRIKGFEQNWNIASIDQKEIKYKYLPSGEYAFEYFASYNGKKSEVKSYLFEVESPFWIKWWFVVLIVLIGMSVMFFFFSQRLRRIRKRQQEELLKQELKADFVEAELKALRSQMNPHFIFNALNSIQALILESELESSYDYLVLFSKLVRKTLNYSNEEFISLESEIDFLRIYLSLEKLRFDDFDFVIEVNGDEDVYLPSLTIQPFVENALLHGLQHKADDKKIAIRFDVDEYFINCIVEDNGIGRKASSEINERLGKEHQSYALKSIEKRLSMYHETFGDRVGVTITDLEENRQAIGTKVDLVLPLEIRF